VETDRNCPTTNAPARPDLTLSSCHQGATEVCTDLIPRHCRLRLLVEEHQTYCTAGWGCWSPMSFCMCMGSCSSYPYTANEVGPFKMHDPLLMRTQYCFPGPLSLLGPLFLPGPLHPQQAGVAFGCHNAGEWEREVALLTANSYNSSGPHPRRHCGRRQRSAWQSAKPVTQR
jgi:hypothetical protein